MNLLNTKFYFLLPVIFSFFGCYTTRVSVVDGYVMKKEKIIGFKTSPDTIYYIKLWNGDVITEAEFDRRWDRTLKKVNKDIKKKHNIE